MACEHIMFGMLVASSRYMCTKDQAKHPVGTHFLPATGITDYVIW